MIDRAERQLDWLVRRARFALLARLHPELRTLRDDRDRRWALWFASDAAPAWRRWLAAAFVLVIAPASLVLGAAILFSVLGWSFGHRAPLAVIAIWTLGIIAASWLVELTRQRQVRGKCFLAMRIAGHDICPGCGYTMIGHKAERDRLRTCPECGGDVPPPPSMALTALTRS